MNMEQMLHRMKELNKPSMLMAITPVVFLAMNQHHGGVLSYRRNHIPKINQS